MLLVARVLYFPVLYFDPYTNESSKVHTCTSPRCFQQQATTFRVIAHYLFKNYWYLLRKGWGECTFTPCLLMLDAYLSVRYQPPRKCGEENIQFVSDSIWNCINNCIFGNTWYIQDGETQPCTRTLYLWTHSANCSTSFCPLRTSSAGDQLKCWRVSMELFHRNYLYYLD